jgi:hypothetical protein
VVSYGAGDEGRGLLAPFCLRGAGASGRPALQELVLRLEALAGAAVAGATEAGGALTALVAAAMAHARLVHVLRQFEVALAHAEGLAPGHAGALATLMGSLRGTQLYARVDIILQDQLVRTGVGTWRASRASVELLTLLLGACDPKPLSQGAAPPLRTQLVSLLAGVSGASPDLRHEIARLRAHVRLARMAVEQRGAFTQ